MTATVDDDDDEGRRGMVTTATAMMDDDAPFPLQVREGFFSFSFDTFAN
jgi:hypothetical protein